jgi:hypothetical protein
VVNHEDGNMEKVTPAFIVLVVMLGDFYYDTAALAHLALADKVRQCLNHFKDWCL